MAAKAGVDRQLMPAKAKVDRCQPAVIIDSECHGPANRMKYILDIYTKQLC